MPCKTGLVGQHIEIVVEDLTSFFCVFNDNGSCCISDDPVEKGRWELVADGLVYNDQAIKLVFNLVYCFEVGDAPQRKFVCGNVQSSVDRFTFRLCISGKIKTRHYS